MAKTPAAIIYDATGTNAVGVVLDGTFYRLQVEAKLADGHGLATEETLEAVLADTDALSSTIQNEGAGDEQRTNSVHVVEILRLIYLEIRELRMIMSAGTEISFREGEDDS